MTLGEQVLQKVADWRPAGRDVLTIPDTGSGWTAQVTADRAGDLGVKVREAAFRRQVPLPEGSGAVRDWAERAAGKVTSLLEPLRVLEVDPSRGEALLRSAEPARKEEQLSYYEVLLTAAGEATVRRFSSKRQPGHRREQVPFALTHEALAKLADDLTATA